jgi:RNA polymerase sigma-70 factor (ECF subfamily)
VTDPVAPLHSPSAMLGVASAPSTDGPHAPAAEASPDFDTVYDTYFPYVWRSVRRLGVPESQVDDVVQEVFIVVHRRLADFEARSTLKTWLYGIALRVARVHRARYRKTEGPELDADRQRAPEATRPDERAANAEAVQLVQAILDGIDDEQREVFVLAELEQLSVPEIARALDVKLNTVYSRLRLARAAFAEGAARLRARDRWRTV